jgi:hypothetical protein
MRTMRLSLAGTFILALLAGTSIAVAQEAEDAEAMTSPVVVTGTLECLGAAPADQAADAGASLAPDGTVINLHEWVASDARLSGEVAYTGTWHVYGEPSEDTGTTAAQDQAIYEIVNEGGKWLCEASRIPDPMVPSEEHTLVFNGQGAYEGMTAYLHIDWSQAPFAFTGLILPGEAPPYAEPQG